MGINSEKAIKAWAKRKSRYGANGISKLGLIAIKIANNNNLSAAEKVSLMDKLCQKGYKPKSQNKALNFKQIEALINEPKALIKEL